MNFETDVLGPVRQATSKNVIVPSHGGWRAEDLGADGVRVCLELPANALGSNIQSDAAAAPFFALCIAWWYEQHTGRTTRVFVRLCGDPPRTRLGLRHWRRSAILLDDVAAALRDRFIVKRDDGRRAWPERPVINAPRGMRALEHSHEPSSEHALEVQICDSSELLHSFPADLSRLERQLPIGLFDGDLSDDTSWTPGKNSQVDLWGISCDGRTAHLIELKAKGNVKVGLLPEALYYARVLHHVRCGRILEGGAQMAAIRHAERIVMWLVAPRYHPLLYTNGKSPLTWINEAMAADGVELRLLPIDLDDSARVRWKSENQWPAPRAPHRIIR